MCPAQAPRFQAAEHMDANQRKSKTKSTTMLIGARGPFDGFPEYGFHHVLMAPLTWTVITEIQTLPLKCPGIFYSGSYQFVLCYVFGSLGTTRRLLFFPASI